jgi:uncharacterized membrane-anchored protein
MILVRVLTILALMALGLVLRPFFEWIADAYGIAAVLLTGAVMIVFFIWRAHCLDLRDLRQQRRQERQDE